MITWADTKKALQLFIVEATGLPGKRVIWERQGKPRPKGDYISLVVKNIQVLGTDELRYPDADSESTQVEQAGQRPFTLGIRIFTEDFFTDGTNIQARFENKEHCLNDLKKQQIVQIVIDDLEAVEYRFLIESIPFIVKVADPGATLIERQTLIRDAINAQPDLEECWIRGWLLEPESAPSTLEVRSTPGGEYTWGTSYEALSMVLLQTAIDVAHLGDHGLNTVPEEVRNDFIGSGSLDVVLSTHSSVIGDFVRIEKVLIKDETTGDSVEVDIDNPPYLP